jgi:tyrosyl-tRNA synthetase
VRVAEEVSALLFAKGDPRALSAEALAALAREVPSAEVPRPEGGVASLDALDLFTAAGLAKSKGEARRLLEQGGLTVGDGDTLPGGYLLLRKGARDYAVVRLG